MLNVQRLRNEWIDELPAEDCALLSQQTGLTVRPERGECFASPYSLVVRAERAAAGGGGGGGAAKEPCSRASVALKVFLRQPGTGEAEESSKAPADPFRHYTREVAALRSLSGKTTHVPRVLSEFNLRVSTRGGSSTSTLGKAFIMPWFSRNLFDVLTEDALSAELAWSVVRAVCDVYVVAHGLRICNRDVKPDNIALDDHGTPIVLDWNLAWNPDERSTAARVGTPYYMPKAGNASDESADLFRLGTLMYAMLFRSPPVYKGADPVPVLLGAERRCAPLTNDIDYVQFMLDLLQRKVPHAKAAAARARRCGKRDEDDISSSSNNNDNDADTV